jgi:hypothetical protein
MAQALLGDEAQVLGRFAVAGQHHRTLAPLVAHQRLEHRDQLLAHRAAR